MPRSADEVDRWIRDHEAQHARDKSERRLEDERLIDAVKKHVEGAVKPLADVPTKLDALALGMSKLEVVNDEQLAIARESAEERGRRKEREELAAQKKSDDERELERQKQRTQRWQIAAGVITAVVVALIGALVAAHK